MIVKYFFFVVADLKVMENNGALDRDGSRMTEGRPGPYQTKPSPFVDLQTYASVVKYGRNPEYTQEMEDADREELRREMLEAYALDMEQLKRDKIRIKMEFIAREKNNKLIK